MKSVVALASAGIIVAAVTVPLPASAGSALAAIPVGRTMTYHLTSQSVTQSGPQSASHYIKFTHSAPTSFSVSVDGAPGQTISVGANGTLNAPPQLKDVLKPFAQIGLLLRGAPKPFSANATWPVNLPVPIDNDTVNVPMVMRALQASHTHATIAGSGSGSTKIQPGVRQFPTNVNATTNIGLGADFTIASASSNVTIVVHVGRLGREKQYSSSWTIAPVQ
ncbi:MAG: hypothetical protein ABI431_03145 [Candidatus Tumulicola sp.]